MLLGPSARTVRGQLVELALSFHHVGPRNQTQFVRPGGGCFCPLNHLTNLKFLLYSKRNKFWGIGELFQQLRGWCFTPAPTENGSELPVTSIPGNLTLFSASPHTVGTEHTHKTLKVSFKNFLLRQNITSKIICGFQHTLSIFKSQRSFLNQER